MMKQTYIINDRHAYVTYPVQKITLGAFVYRISFIVGHPVV